MSLQSRVKRLEGQTGPADGMTPERAATVAQQARLYLVASIKKYHGHDLNENERHALARRRQPSQWTPAHDTLAARLASIAQRLT